jgi:hypothetical protein
MLASRGLSMAQPVPHVQPNILSKLLTRYLETLGREPSERNVD